MKKRILVYGGRKYNNKYLVYKVLNAAKEAHEIECIISGMAPGADTLGYMWAKDNNIPCLEFPADWEKHPKAAGPIRNQQMIDEGKPNLAFGFPGDKGTKDMAKRLRKARIVNLPIIDNEFVLV